METTNKYFKRLKEIKEAYPALTFNNNGYEYLSKQVQESHKEQINEIAGILKETLKGFVKFNNFKVREDGTVVIRVQYHWDNSFVGVGYFNLAEWENFKP